MTSFLFHSRGTVLSIVQYYSWVSIFRLYILPSLTAISAVAVSILHDFLFDLDSENDIEGYVESQ